MNANEILSMPVKMVEARIATAMFNNFAKHFKVTDQQASLAWKNFEDLQKMDISLSLALTTAIAIARF